MSKVLMPPHPLKNFEIQKYYQNEPKLNVVYSKNSLAKIEYGAYMIDGPDGEYDEYESMKLFG